MKTGGDANTDSNKKNKYVMIKNEKMKEWNQVNIIILKKYETYKRKKDLNSIFKKENTTCRFNLLKQLDFSVHPWMRFT